MSTIPDSPTIQLLPLTRDNWKECANLSVADFQSNFIPSNLLSIAAAQFYPDNVMRAIYTTNEQMIGLALYGIEEFTARKKIFRLMIAQKFQRQGFGKAAMKLILEGIEEKWHPREIYVSFQNDNDAARYLYTSFDFQEIERTGNKITARRTA